MHDCPFCHRSYSRQDALRRHCLTCPRRANRPIPRPTAIRGRKRHTCEQCRRQKVFCDGLIPCTACSSRQIQCSKTDQLNQAIQKPSSSVVSLLHDEYDEVFSKFNFPAPPKSSPVRSIGHELGVPDHATDNLSFDFMDALLDFESFFGLETPQLDLGPTALVASHDEFHVLDNDAAITTLRSRLIDAANACSPPLHEKSDVLEKLNIVFDSANVALSIKYFFECWHPNCRAIHRPSLSITDLETPLLAAIVLLGAMYVPIQELQAQAHAVAECVERFVFSQRVFDQASEGHIRDENVEFQMLQAGMLVVVAQFWAGDEISKRKASTHLFDRVTETSRLLALTKVSQTLEDRQSETMWLAKESRVRFINCIVLLDCAFLFFKGLPLRIVSSEVECDLPCADTIFEAANPFTHPGFAFKRVLNVQTAFQALFDARPDDHRWNELNVLDTFILIHMLYRYISDIAAAQLCRSPNGISRDSQLEIGAALNHWRHHWLRLKQKATRDGTWERLGFFKNGDQYEAAIRLLLSEKAKPHLRRLLGGRIDRLAELKKIGNL